MIIHLKKKDIPNYIIMLELFFTCFVYFFIDVIGIPAIFKYSCDVLNIILSLYIFLKLKSQQNIMSKNIFSILLIVGSFILLSFVFWIPSNGDFLLLLWGSRNTFRFLIFFVACILFLDKFFIDKILAKVDLLIIINFLLCLFQFIVLGLSGDNIGGSFGTASGCNAPLNVLLVIVTAFNASKYVTKEKNIIQVIFYIGLCAIIAGMAELKVYVFEVIFIIILVGIFSKGLMKKISIAIIAVIFSLSSIRLIEMLIPGWEGFFTIENMYKMISSTEGYTSTGDLNRLTSITTLNKIFFSSNINWIGFGLGNSEYSDSFLFLNSPFFKSYGYLHYGWFSIAKIYLELGWFGIIGSVSIWGYTLICTLNCFKKEYFYKTFIGTMSIICTFFFFYNNTMNLDGAYLIYVCLSFTYVLNKENQVLKLM